MAKTKADLERQIRLLVEALTYYADPDTYRRRPDEKAAHFGYRRILTDHGEIAKAALEQVGAPIPLGSWWEE